MLFICSHPSIHCTIYVLPWPSSTNSDSLRMLKSQEQMQTWFNAAALCFLTWGKDPMKTPPGMSVYSSCLDMMTLKWRLCADKQLELRMPGPRQEVADLLWSCCLPARQQSLHLLWGSRSTTCLFWQIHHMLARQESLLGRSSICWVRHAKYTWSSWNIETIRKYWIQVLFWFQRCEESRIAPTWCWSLMGLRWRGRSLCRSCSTSDKIISV